VLRALAGILSDLKGLWLKAWARPRPALFPLGAVARGADPTVLRADLLAGLTVALLAFPMAMAFAMKAGLPVWCGIVGCGVAAFVAPIFSGSANLSAGPTNASAALLLGAFATLGAVTPEMRVAALPTLLLMTGVFLLLASWLRLGGFADFVPRTVISAYIAAAALRVIALQLPTALNLPGDHTGQSLPEVLWATVQAGKALLNPDLGLAVVTAIVYALLRRPYGVGKAILGAIAVASLGAYIGQSVALGQGSRADLVHYVGDAARTANALHLPEFSARTFSTLFSPALALAVLVIIEGTANARASALKTGRGSDLHQEIFGLGMANLACCLTGGMAASGSITRSALNVSSGARTAYASMFCGAFILAAGYVASYLVAHVPLACLATLVIAAELELANLPVVRLILQSGAQDRTVFLATFVTALVAPLDVAIFFGTGVAVRSICARPPSPRWWNTISPRRANCARAPRGKAPPASPSCTSKVACTSAPPKPSTTTSDAPRRIPT
jgi:SulP family sulfate permease